MRACVWRWWRKVCVRRREWCAFRCFGVLLSRGGWLAASCQLLKVICRCSLAMARSCERMARLDGLVYGVAEVFGDDVIVAAGVRGPVYGGWVHENV
eukprot:11770079-Alexandrium_andersonii.AAC.1